MSARQHHHPRIVPVTAHEIGTNPKANGTALTLWHQASTIFSPQRGFTMGSIRLENDPGPLGLLGKKDSVFEVAGHGYDKMVSGVLEVRVSQLTGRIKVSPFVHPEQPLRPKLPVWRTTAEKLPAHYQRFLRALGRD